MPRRSPVERLDEDVDSASAGETDGERLVVRDAVRHDVRSFFPGQHRKSFFDDRALDAPTGHRPGDLAVLVHDHRCAGIAGTGPLDFNHARDGDALTCCAPAFDVLENFFHFAITSTSFSSDSRECPSTN